MVKFVQEVKKEKMRVMEMVAHHLYVNQKKAIGMSLVWLLGELVVRNIIHQGFMLMLTITWISFYPNHIEGNLYQENHRLV